MIINEEEFGPKSGNKRRRGRPRNIDLTEEERRAHRRLKPKQRVQNRQCERLITITLKLPHGRNGVWIGPGEVTVPYGLAQELLYAEEGQAWQARKLQDFWKGDINAHP